MASGDSWGSTSSLASLSNDARSSSGSEAMKLIEPTLPLDRLVTDVPDEAEPAAWTQNAVNLSECPVAVEPVERLRAEDGVDRSVRDRNRLGRPRKRLHLRKRLRELAAHP